MPTLMPIKTEKAKMIRLLMPIDGIERTDDSLIVSGYCFVNEDIGSGKKIKRAAMEAATDDYMTWGAVREMHRPSAVGTAIGELEDGSKLGVEWRKEGAYFRCKIVDSEAIKKCEEGVYRAFSIGVNPTIVRGDWVLACTWAEISLVDRPGDKDCPFDALSRTEDAESEVAVLERMSFNEYVSCQETGQRIYAAFDWLLSSIYDIRSSESDEKSALVRQTCAEFAEYIGPLVDEEGETRSMADVLARLGRLEAEENAEITRLGEELESRDASIAELRGQLKAHEDEIERLEALPARVPIKGDLPKHVLERRFAQLGDPEAKAKADDLREEYRALKAGERGPGTATVARMEQIKAELSLMGEPLYKNG